MGVTNFKNIPTRTQWATARNAAGGKAGMSKKAEVGKLLDAFHKAPQTNAGQLAALKTLREGMTLYTADPAVKKVNDLHNTAMSIFNLIKKEELAMKTNKDIGLQIGLLVTDGYKRLQKVEMLLNSKKVKEAGLDYEKFYDGIGRGVGQKLATGTLRDDWLAAHAKLPTREDISKCKGDFHKIREHLRVGIPGYRKALEKLLKDAQKSGMDVKLS